MLQIKEQKVVVDELSNLRKNRVSKVIMRNTDNAIIINGNPSRWSSKLKTGDATTSSATFNPFILKFFSAK